MPDIGLSPQQLAVICALSSGATMTAAAGQAGVHRNTISNWRRTLLPFQHALAGAQYDRALHFREKAEELVDLAVKTIHDLLTDSKTPAGVRLKAALAIFQTAATPPEPKKQITLEIEKINIEKATPVHNDAQSEPLPTETPASHNDARVPAPRESAATNRALAAAATNINGAA